jgi:superfamily II DNA or RNA helicase
LADSFQLRDWQRIALPLWREQDRRGIVSVVTGGGKTMFALACVADARPDTTLVVVPTVALLDQWWEEAASFFALDLDEVNIVSGSRGLRSGTINIGVLNTVAALVASGRSRRCMLIIDECHKAASPKFRSVLDVQKDGSLGLSATPERQYDDGLSEILVPALGPVFYTYSYADALKDKVIVPFALRNVVFELESDRQEEYDRLTKAIARSIARNGADAEQSVALMRDRSATGGLRPIRWGVARRSRVQSGQVRTDRAGGRPAGQAVGDACSASHRLYSAGVSSAADSGYLCRWVPRRSNTQTRYAS